jgi:hypothetical protein
MEMTGTLGLAAKPLSVITVISTQATALSIIPRRGRSGEAILRLEHSALASMVGNEERVKPSCLECVEPGAP